MQLHVSVAAAALAVFSLVDAAQLSWTDAYTKAKKDVAALSLAQKVDVATGIGWMNGPCVGNTPPIDKIDFPGLCLQDSPLGVRFAFNASGGIAGLNVASSFDKTLALQRAHDMGVEFREKGVNVQLGPDVNMARVPEAGRNWEGFGEDPYLTGVMGALTVEGIQDEGVVSKKESSCFKYHTISIAVPRCVMHEPPNAKIRSRYTDCHSQALHS